MKQQEFISFLENKNEQAAINLVKNGDIKPNYYITIEGEECNIRVTPLHLACSYGAQNLVKYLLEQNVLIERFLCDGNVHILDSEIDVVIADGNIDILKILLEHLKKDPNYPKEERVAYYIESAIKLGHLQSLKYLLDEEDGVKIIKQHNSLHNVLFKNFNIPNNVLNLLRDYKCDFNVKNNDGNTLLHILAAKGSLYFGVIKALIGYGAKLNEINNKGDTPLHIALREKEFDIASYLIEHGAIWHIKNKEGMRAENYCAQNDDALKAKINKIGNVTQEVISFMQQNKFKQTDSSQLPKEIVIKIAEAYLSDKEFDLTPRLQKVILEKALKTINKENTSNISL